MPVFDLIIPLGFNCAAAGQLKARELRLAAFPFDWLAAAEVPNRWEIPLRALESRFNAWLNPDNLEPNGEQRADAYDAYASVFDRVAAYSFGHDFRSSTPTLEEVTNVRAKYARRIERMVRMLEEAQSVLFVITGDDSELPTDVLRQVLARLETCFPGKKLKLYAFTFSAPEASEEGESETDIGLFVQRNATPWTLYSARYHGWEARWLDTVHLSGKIRSPGEHAQAMVSPRTLSEKIHWKLFKHTQKYCLRHGFLPTHFED